MDPTQTEVILRRFETPDDVREMVKGRFEIGASAASRSGGQPTSRGGSGRGTLVRRAARAGTVTRVGLVLSGTATAAFGDGRVIELPGGRPVRHPADPDD